MNTFLIALVSGVIWSLALLVTAVPWVVALDPRAFRVAIRRPANWGLALAVCLGLGAALAFSLSSRLRLVWLASLPLAPLWMRTVPFQTSLARSVSAALKRRPHEHR